MLPVEKIEEDSLDSITFNFIENSNYWQESLLEVIRQNIAGWCQRTFCFQNAQQYFAFTPQANFPAHNSNFHWRLNPGYLLEYFLLYSIIDEPHGILWKWRETSQVKLAMALWNKNTPSERIWDHYKTLSLSQRKFAKNICPL